MREERDSLGRVEVPEEAYYGAQTQRAKDIFQISGQTLPPVFVRALGLIKARAARVNLSLGLLDPKRAEAIVAAAGEVARGEFNDQFVVDVFQTGSGTSTNMNANEVIAGRANEILTGKRGGKEPVHPNDHVNRGQSSNDVIPTAIRLAALLHIREVLLPGLEKLEERLSAKAGELAGVAKIGRTHLQDAVVMTLGQEFGAFAHQVRKSIDRVGRAQAELSVLPLGGTAVGSGLNTHPRFAARVIAGLAGELGLPLSEAENHFEAQAAQDSLVAAGGGLKTVAISLAKISNDIRLLGSGPRAGLGEINLPRLQPGSSIMPGKVNPVVPEAVIQVAAQVLGHDLTLTLGGLGGYFQLNTMMPLMAHNLLRSIELLGRAAELLAEKCVAGISPNRARCAQLIQGSLALSTYLVPALGYDRSAALAEEAYETGRNIREVAIESGLLEPEEIDRLLAPALGPAMDPAREPDEAAKPEQPTDTTPDPHGRE